MHTIFNSELERIICPTEKAYKATERAVQRKMLFGSLSHFIFNQNLHIT